MLFTIIDRYIAKVFLGFFLGGLIVLVTLFVSVDFMSNMVRFDTTTEQIIKFYLYYTPWIADRMIPVACLLGTIFTLGQLNRNNELVALFSSGLSLARIAAPILTLVVLISGFSFFLSDRLLPIVSQKRAYLYYVEIRKEPWRYSTVKTDRIWYRSNNIIFNIATLQPERSHAQGLTMYYFGEGWRLIQMLQANEVQIAGKEWQLKKGTVTLFDPTSGAPMTQEFEQKIVSMPEDTLDLQATQTTESLSLKELRRFIKRNKDAGLDTLRYEVDYQAKFSFAFASFLMSFIGIPFSVGKARSGSMAFQVGLSLGLAFSYYAFYTSGLSLGQHGILPPLIAAWLPNLVTLFVTVFLFWRLKR